MWKYGSKTIKEGRSWTSNDGITHPSNWHIWSADEKAAAGLTEVTPETPPDSRLYSWSMNPDGTINKSARNLDDTDAVDRDGNKVKDENGNQVINPGVKSSLKQEVKDQQGALLAQTDWAIVRKADKGTAIPSNIQDWRDAIRAKATDMENAIDNAANTDAVAALFVSYTNNGDGSVTQSGILYDWPELE